MGFSFERPCVFASEEWCTVPYLSHGKLPFDVLGDILLQFPSIYILRNSMRMIREQSPYRCEPTRSLVEAKAMYFMIQLNAYWDMYGTAIDPDYDYTQFIETSDFQSDPSSWVIETPLPITFKNTLVATNIAMYDTAVVLANALAWESTSGYPEVNKRQIVIHCASILAAVAYHESKGPNSGGSINMVFPMKVVRRATPSNDQRRQIQAALDTWGERRGVEGLCRFVVPERHGIYGNIQKMEAAQQMADSSAPRFDSRNLSPKLIDIGYSDVLGCSGGLGRGW